MRSTISFGPRWPSGPRLSRQPASQRIVLSSRYTLMSEADSRRGDNGDSGTDARDRLLEVLNRAKLNPTQADPATRRPTFFLVRHAESTGNLQACLQGSRIGGSLSERGRKQSTATAMYLFNAFEELRQGNVRLVSSPS